MPTQGYQFDGDSVRRISDAVRIIEQRQTRLAAARPAKQLTNDGWCSFKNTSSETAIAHGLMRLDASPELVTGLFYNEKFTKPDTTFGRIFAVNSGTAVPAGGYGLCRLSGDVLVAYDTGTPAINEGFGPKPGQWTASKNYPQCLVCRGVIDSTAKIMLATLGVIEKGLAKANGTIAFEGNGAISICAGAGLWTTDIIGMDPNAVNLGPSVASGDKLVFDHLNGQLVFQKVCSS